MSFWVAGAAVVGAIGGAVINSNAQKSAAGKARSAQERAALLQAQTQAGVYNANAMMNAPGRALGGLAQSRQAYLLGLTPNLDISSSFATPVLDPATGRTVYIGPGGQQVQAQVDRATGYTGATGTNVSQPKPTGGRQMDFLDPRRGLIGGEVGEALGLGGVFDGPQRGINTGEATFAPGNNVDISSDSGLVVMPDGSVQQRVTTGGNALSGAPAGTTPQAGIPDPNAIYGGAGYGSFAQPLMSGDFTTDPSYGFRFDEGQRALERSLAYRGLSRSGAALREATNFGQGLASTEFQNAWTRAQQERADQWNMLSGLSTQGQNATNSVTGAGQTAAQGISGAFAAQGNAAAAEAAARAAASTNATNQIIGGINTGIGIWQGSKTPNTTTYTGGTIAPSTLSAFDTSTTYQPSSGFKA